MTERQQDGSFTTTLATPKPEEFDALWKAYTEQKVNVSATELKGIVASMGKTKKVRGIVKILLYPSESAKFEPGNILVAPMTSPEYVFVMKESTAILTDAGGLTSHAAIVSRELEKPCLVGLKSATQLLHDGDEVEVDANAGVVRVLKRV